MPQLRILCWNIQDLGTDQVNDDSFLDMMVAVIHASNVDLACILETKADEGVRLGGLLKGKLDTKTGKTWDHHGSPKSGPKSNKPENYVFVWDTAVVTSAAGWKFPDCPPAAGFVNKHIKCRFPYLGDVTVNGKTITLITFHTCFETSSPGTTFTISARRCSTTGRIVRISNRPSRPRSSRGKPRNATPWVNIAGLLPTDTVTTVQKAHEIYFDSISDHLPIRLQIDVS